MFDSGSRWTPGKSWNSQKLIPFQHLNPRRRRRTEKYTAIQLREENEPASYSFLTGTSDKPLELGPGIRKPLFIHQVLTIFGQGRCGQNMGTSPPKKWLGVPLLFLSPTSIPQQRIFGTVGPGCWLSPWEDLPEALRFFWMGSFGTGSSLLRNARRFWWGLWLQIVGFPLNQPKNGYIGSAKTVGPPKNPVRPPKNRGPKKLARVSLRIAFAPEGSAPQPPPRSFPRAAAR